MKCIFFGEFIEISTTGIAYMNTQLKDFLILNKIKTKIIYEPSASSKLLYDHNNRIKSLIRNKSKFFNFLRNYVMTFIDLFNAEPSEISIITISVSNVGLIKTILVLTILRLKTKKSLVFVHRGDLQDVIERNLFNRFFINLIILLSKKFIFLTNPKNLNIINRSLLNKSHILPNSLNKKDCIISEKLYDEKLTNLKKSLIKNSFRIIFSSNVSKSKGVFQLIEAVKICRRKGIKIKLDIYGMNFDEINNDEDYITYRGKLTYENRLYKMSTYDCLVLPSNTEGMPLVLIESMAIGLPFICTNVGAIKDLVGNNYPFYCEKEPNSIATYLEKYFLDYVMKDKISLIKKNRSYFENSFTNKIYIENLNRLFGGF